MKRKMNKKVISFPLLFVFIFLIFCGCGSSQPEAEISAVVKQASDAEGNKYSVVMGSDGFLLLGKGQSLAITVDDEDGNPGKNLKGEYVTKAVDFPDTLTVDGEIHTRFYKLKIPDKWKNKSEGLLKIEYVKGKERAEITVNERFSMTVDECLKEVEGLTSFIGEAEKSKVSLDFAQSTKLVVGKRLALYVFNAEGRTYYVKCMADESLFEEIDFETIVNTIKFRKGE